MKKLEAERARLKMQIASLQGELIGIERAIAMLNGDEPGETPPVEVPRRTRRANVKNTVLRMLQEHPGEGLGAGEVVDAAAKQGINLDRASVSSYLSKLKGEGTLVLKDSRYRLADASRTVENEPSAPANFH